MNAIYALYSDLESARRAVNSLTAAAPALEIAERDIVVLSSEPLEEYSFSQRDAKTHMPWFAALGGLLGGMGGYALAAYSQTAYPLPTGGMPIVTPWTNSIITYETAMLGAILVTLVTLLVTARLPRLRKRLYNPEVSNGKILIGVMNAPENSRPEIESRLRAAGTSDVQATLR